MSLLQSLLHVTDFQNGFCGMRFRAWRPPSPCRRPWPVPSMLAQTERFYDLSGAVTNISVAALSLYLPVLRARQAGGGGSGAGPLPGILEPFTSPATAAFNWRQVALTAAATVWATRRMSFFPSPAQHPR